MIQYGRSIRWFNDYKDEVEFSKRNGFDFIQVWYLKGSLLLDKVPEPKEKTIKDYGYPVIIHALFDINDYEEHLPRLIEILDYLSHTEVIIHPICESEEINEKTIVKLCEKISFASRQLKSKGIRLVLENNSKLDPIHYKVSEIKFMFSNNPEIELLLDIAHIDSYDHLRDIASVKKPSILHVSDKHFNIVHEHLPVGMGELDYKKIFEEILYDFEGKVIFEIIDTDEIIIQSKQIIKDILDRDD